MSCSVIAEPTELSELAELGVLFLLFEMGLELSSTRLAALKKYTFGLGVAQVVFTTFAFVAFAYPFGNSIGTYLLRTLAHVDDAMASIRTWDEAIVIAVALSLSSSAFVLQLLGDQGQLATRSGSATLGILLLQDLVTVPFLVLLPILEKARVGEGAAGGADVIALVTELLPPALTSLGLLGAIALLGRFGLRWAFSAVASSSSNDAFVAACLLTVCGTASATQAAGFGQTLGAFLAGVILAESSFRPQVEAELKPFKGVLLGLFFLCTGSAVDVDVLFSQLPFVLLLTVGLISVKFAITSISCRLFGLTQAESVKVGMTLSQGGEFAFVLLALAQEERILPEELNKILICVVVLSMALTPILAEWGQRMEIDELEAEQKRMGESLKFELMGSDGKQALTSEMARAVDYSDERPVVILGFNDASQVVANMLSSPLIGKHPWLGFSFNPDVVRLANESGLPVFFGDGSCGDVLHAAGVRSPRAFILTLRSHPMLLAALGNVKKDFPGTPIYALAKDMRRAVEIEAQGAHAIAAAGSAGVALGDVLLRGLLDTSAIDVVFLEQEMVAAMQRRVREKASAAQLPAPQAVDADEDSSDAREVEQREKDDLRMFVLDPAQTSQLAASDKQHRDRTLAKLRLWEANRQEQVSQAPDAADSRVLLPPRLGTRADTIDAFNIPGSGEWDQTSLLSSGEDDSWDDHPQDGTLLRTDTDGRSSTEPPRSNGV